MHILANKFVAIEIPVVVVVLCSWDLNKQAELPYFIIGPQLRPLAPGAGPDISGLGVRATSKRRFSPSSTLGAAIAGNVHRGSSYATPHL